MTTANETKINRLLQMQPKNVVYTSKWLVEEGYSKELQRAYRKTGWFKRIGAGALIRTGETPDYLGGVYALQNQLGMSVHPGGKTALALWGKAHYLNFAPSSVNLYGYTRERLPSWFRNYDWQVTINYQTHSALPQNLGLKKWNTSDFELYISTPLWAFIEMLLEQMNEEDYVPYYELMLGLNNLVPIKVQQMLEQCSHIKAKRLFLFMAEKASHQWFKHLNLDAIDLGRGKRSLVKNGVYVPKYQITIPKELMEYE